MSEPEKHHEILQQVLLQANSPCHAWYRLRLLHIRDGYVIEKSSGRSGGQGKMEAWFRWRREDAEEVFAKIIQRKTKPSRLRVYHPNSSAAQLELFCPEP